MGEKKAKRRGRPTKLTREISEAFIKQIKVAGSLDEIAASFAIDISTVHRWRQRGDEMIAAGKRGLYRDFCEGVRRAFKERDLLREQLMVKHGTKDWRAIWQLMIASNPRKYAPRIRVHVEEELTGAIERLCEAFKDDPENLERALSALSEGDRGGEAEQDPFGAPDPDDREGGEAVQPTPTEPEAAVVSRP